MSIAMSLEIVDVALVSRVLAFLLLALIVYPYLVYPALLWLLRRYLHRPWIKGEFTPNISVIMAAHNELAVITQKIENTLALDYPPERLEIIVVSDCSTDGTNEIVESYAPRVKLVPLTDRSGKQIALNRAVDVATGDILLFTDASVNLSPKVAKYLARNFLDPNVGAVSTVIKITKEGTDRFPVAEHDGPTDAEGAYLGFDITTRAMEAEVYSAVGCCGSCYATRKSCFEPFHPADCNDFASALDAVRRGYRVVMDPEAVGYMLPARTIEGEFKRKARTIAGGLWTLAQVRHWPSITGHLLFWWCLFSHKVARWAGPLALVFLVPVSLVGGFAGAWELLLLATGIIGAFAIGYFGWKQEPLRRFAPFRMAAFAVVAITAALRGWQMYITHDLPVVWAPTVRIEGPADAAVTAEVPEEMESIDEPVSIAENEPEPSQPPVG